ncbi:MAG: YdeI/OmpD-associated family protein [Chloroflexi bacterium]|nr:YdeI/OmpD-associated family protein [Chloroflexota bacterium]MBU1750838.1 YdeI/OmpD-associated family protein [Chloroflexota bacterium]MBU1878549.1 YdeI/OmpD-associated family protein [Chloroflexota bacterium]
MSETRQPSRLTRPRYEMPDFVQQALLEHELMEAYRSRPPYQQNDYIGWITRAKRQETKEKRLGQMLDELARGDKYMNMNYQPKQCG